MTDNRQKAAKEFADYWKDKGYEKGDCQPFWLSLLGNVFGIEHPEKFISFEDQVHLDHTSFIDGRIPATKVLIEQKGINKDLNKPIKQSDGSLLTPFQQAKRYITELPVSEHPRWVVTSNFEKFFVYDMERPNVEPEEILLKDLPKEYYRLEFLVDSENKHLKKEMEVSIAAGEIVGRIYDEFYKQYAEPDSKQAQKSLNILCVRLVFCLYAEDAGIFGHHGMFFDYLKKYPVHQMRKALIELFHVLDTKPEDRDPYLKDDSPELAAFPYVNGGLFANEDIEIPPFTDEIRELILEHASNDFNWSEISPTIFGAVFESTLNPETRRKGGMHYTSIENIHKVIDPLFLDDLKKELAEIEAITVEKTKKHKLKDFQAKLSQLKFLDPACGSGNFLTETYICLRKLENKVIRDLVYEQLFMRYAGEDPIKVSIKQFYGIEINDFAVTVAKTALWIAESQMFKETEKITLMNLDFLPLKSYSNIIEGNSLEVNWEDVVPKHELNYIMGNPPFVGARIMDEKQKADVIAIFGEEWKGAGNLDYVSCWYKKSADLMAGTNIRTALVSTNSITQGEQVSILWKPLFNMGVHIDFAHQTFRWDSEANITAHVHCVIVGFSIYPNSKPKELFVSNRVQMVDNINAYLVDAPNVFLENMRHPLCNVTPIVFGSMPNDDGYLSNYSLDEKNNIISKYPVSGKMFRKFLGATEFLNNKERYCLWLKDISPVDIRKVPCILDAVLKVKEKREQSGRKSTRELAKYPTLFGEIRQPNNNYIIVPAHSSSNRKYVPIGFSALDIIASNALLVIPNANLYTFGVLTSNVHNAWIRTVCGRIKSDYRYSANIVYNNFPWPDPTAEQKSQIEKTAQAILDARNMYPDSSLADLYDELTMPPELRKAHQDNDRAVMDAYGFIKGTEARTSESACVAELMKMYQKLVSERV